VAYSNEIKQSLLEVKEETIQSYGAVSEETAVEMVKNAQRKFNTECAIATTGIAGPTGGTQEKPIGTVWIAVMVNNKLKVERKQFGRIRENNIVRTAQTALLMLQELLQETN
ncbi:MAG: CinA family protein, partial [Bacteroidales bacterium]